MSNKHYKAFISYSREDESFGRWLQDTLETYKIPKSLHEDYPNLLDKLYPIFRDKYELHAGDDLGVEIPKALKNSESLIVICSKHAVASQWVNQEILEFKRMYGEDRVFPILVEGSVAEESFSEALQYTVDQNGELSDQKTALLASDVNDSGDGKELAKLKLIAGLLGIPFGEFHKRDEEQKRKDRKRKFLTWLSVTAVILVLIVFGWYKQQESEEESRKKNHQTGLALLEKAHNALNQNRTAQANLYAYGALKHLNSRLDTTSAMGEARSIIFNYPYIRRAYSIDFDNLKSQNENNKPWENTSGVFSVAISQNGKKIAVGLWDGSIELFDITKKQKHATLKDHDDVVSHLQISEDGNTLISKSYDNSVIFLEKKGEEIKKTVEKNIEQDCIAISKDGKIILLGSKEGTIKLWDKKRGNIENFAKHNGFVNSIAISKDGKTIVAGLSDQSVKVWDRQGEELHTFIGHNGSVESVAISKDGQTILSGSWDRSIKLWSNQSGKILMTLNGHEGPINNIILSEDGKTIISSGDFDSTIKIWDRVSGKLVNTLTDHTGSVNDIAISGDGRTFISGSNDNSLKIWDRENRKFYRTCVGHLDSINSVALSSDGKIILSGSDDRSIKLWDRESGKLIKTIITEGRISNVAISEDGKSIFAVEYKNRTLKVWDRESGEHLMSLPGYEGQIDKIILSEDRKTIISSGARLVSMGGYRDNSLKLWSMENGGLLDTIKVEDKNPIRSLAISNNHKTIISGFHNGEIVLWKIQNEKLLKKKVFRGHRKSVDALVMSKDEKILISSSMYDSIKVWDIQNENLLNLLTVTDNVGAGNIAISRDGKTFVYGAKGNSVKIWDIVDEDINENIKDLEQQLQAKLDGITLVSTKIPYDKPHWSKNHPFHWLDQAQNGNSEAMYQLGLIYDRDNENQKALNWYKKAANKGHTEVKERVKFLTEWMKNNPEH
jgi:WD40 repeat protein